MMIGRIAGGAVVLALTFAAAGAGADREAEEAVRRDFGALKRALVAGDAARAASLASPDSIALFEKCRTLALRGTKEELEGLTQIEVLVILKLRLSLAARTLAAMDGAGVFAWYVRDGGISREVVRHLDLDQVEVQDHHASATLKRRGKRLPAPALQFVASSDGAWKLNLRGLLMLTEPPYASLRKSQKKTKVELAIDLLEASTGRPVPPAVLTGPVGSE